jgi:hypothetical protein
VRFGAAGRLQGATLEELIVSHDYGSGVRKSNLLTFEVLEGPESVSVTWDVGTVVDIFACE